MFNYYVLDGQLQKKTCGGLMVVGVDVNPRELSLHMRRWRAWAWPAARRA